MKNFVSIMKTALCSAAGIFLMTGCTTNYSKMLEEQPQDYVALAVDNTAEAIVKDSFSEEYKFLEEALKNGTFHLEFEVEGITFSGDCYVNEKDETSSMTYTLTGDKGTAAQIYAFADKNSMKLGTIGNSGSHIYSFDMNTLEEKLKNSIFHPDSDSYYALSEDEYKMFLEYAAEINSAIKGEGKDKKDKKDSSDEKSPYEEIIGAYIEAHPPVTTEKAETTINGETVEANIVQYDIPKEDLRTLAEQLFDKALEQEDLIEQSGYSAEELEEAKAEIMESLDELEDYSIQIVYYVNSKTNQLMEFDIGLKWAEPQNPETDIDPDDPYSYLMGAYLNRNGAYDVSVSVVYGADPAASEKQKVQVDFSVDYYDNTYLEDGSGSIIADIAKSENKTEIIVTMTSDGETAELVTITAEKDGENYSVTAEIPELEITAGMTGTIVKDKDSFTMTIDKLFANSGSTEVAYMPKAVISVKKGGELLNLDAEKEFLDITEDELDDLINNIAADFEAVFEEPAEDTALENYVDKAKLSAANADAKLVHTALNVNVVQINVAGETFSDKIITGDSANVTIGGKEIDLTDYLGEDFSGYFYAEADPDNYIVIYTLWSQKPIPDEYKHQLTEEEQQKLQDEGILIGCYCNPLAKM